MSSRVSDKVFVLAFFPPLPPKTQNRSNEMHEILLSTFPLLLTSDFHVFFYIVNAKRYGKRQKKIVLLYLFSN
jgi:hypothetical protein